MDISPFGEVSTCKAALYNKEKYTSYENLFFETKIQLTKIQHLNLALA